MAAESDEEKLLRSAALQNAQSIFLARQRADRELVEAKEALEQKTEELAQQREWFRVTLSSIGDAVITTDTDGKVTFLNAKAEAMTGWRSADASGHPLEKVFNIINEDTRQPAANPLRRVLREGMIVEMMDHTALIAKDGSEASIEDSAAPIRDASGKIVGAVTIFRDVTERRLTERALRQSEEFSRTIIESSRDCTKTLSLDGVVLWINEAAQKILCVGDVREVVGKSWLDFWRDEDREAARAAIQTAAHGGVGNFAGWQPVLGQPRCWDVVITPILDRDGNPERLLAVSRDITERRKLEAIHSRLAAVVEFSDDAIVSKTLDGIITTWNTGAERMFGYAGSEIIGKSVTILIPPDRAHEELKILERLRKGETILPFETIRMRKDGTLLSVSLTVSPIKDSSGAIIGASKIARDITPRKKAEAERARLMSVLEKSLNEIYIFDTENLRFQYVNNGALRNLGYSMEEMRKMTAVNLKPEFTETQYREMVVPLLDGEKEKLVFDTVHRRSDGSFYPVEIHLQSVTYAGEAVFMAVGLDITERKRAEEERERVSAENARLYQELRHANAAKDHFMAVLSHELRTPLNPVLMTIADLERDETVIPAIREQLTVVRRNVELEARLIDDLLDSTGIANGKLQLHRTIVDGTELIRRAIAIVEIDARKKGVDLDVIICPEPCLVDADPARLQQVIWNVAKNAVKFTPPGGSVRVRCEMAPQARIRVTVEDNGIGIEPEHIGKVFNAFEQGDIRTGHRFGGLGLGLAISKALVTLQGGSLTAQSDGRGRGARFIIELPLAAQPTAPMTSGPLPSTHRHHLRLLVVEDHQATSDVMARLLTKRGYSVSVASSIEEASRVLKQNAVDVLISDVGLPDGSGRELMEKLRQTQKLPGIALSGYGTEADLAQSSEAGFSVHLTKPVDIDRLDREIQALATETSAAS